MAAHLLQTISQMFGRAVASRSVQRALGSVLDGQLTWLTWRDLDHRVQRRAAQFQGLGVQSGMPVAQLGPNSVDWIVNDLALHRLAAVHVPIHTALSLEQAVELVRRSGSRRLIARTAEPWSDVFNRDDVTVVTPELLGAVVEVEGLRAGVMTQEDALATILFTSGSTGDPRGVMLTHRNLAENAAATVAALAREAEETRLCFLPLSHIYARTCDLYCWICRGTRLVLVESLETIVRDCQIARPTVINAVPYFYQRLANRRHNESVAEQPDSLRQLLGGEVKHCFCGGAATSPEVELFFERQGLPILSGYGLTETSPVVTATPLDGYERGSVGRPLDNMEVRIAEDGEILVRGPSVMRGYLDDQAATSEAIVDGWFQTGDLGRWTSSGNLQIIGRKKEVIVLATGRKASPAQIEARLHGSPLIEQACVVGEGRPYLVALIVPNADALRREIRSRRLFIWSRRRAITHPKILALYRREIDQRLAEFAEFERVAAFTLLGRGFAVEHGELTPKLSLRRDVIERNLSSEISRLYGPRALIQPVAAT